MNKSRQATVVLLVAVLFILGIFLGFRIERFLYPGGAMRSFNTPVLVQQVQTLSDLVTVKYVVQKVEVWDDPPDGVISQFIQGNNRLLLVAQGVVKAGVDLSKLKPD